MSDEDISHYAQAINAIGKIEDECERLRAENEKLHEALNTVCQSVISERGNIDCVVIEGAALRAATAALKESGDD